MIRATWPVNQWFGLIDANQQIQGPGKHHQSSGLLASFMVTRFTVWV